jgi:hypothetical protein
MSVTSKRTKSSSYPRDALKQEETVKKGWVSVGDKLLVPNLQIEQFQAKLEEARSFVDKAEKLKMERARAVHERNVCLGELWDLTKRIRNSAKATFGDYSPELEMLLSIPEISNSSRNGH